MISRIVPRPLIAAACAIVFVLLVNDISLGAVLLGIFIGLVIAFLTDRYWPGRPSIKKPRAILAYLGIVAKDIAVSNIDVAKLVLFRRGSDMRSQFITIPLDLRSPEAIAMLAGTITLTPGTLSADVSADGRALLVHCLDVADPAAAVADIKDRYERRLKEIFE
ncbi:MAG: Na+/H+ antiporter subunit E [Beijerinckiaceae bacterium]|nr:Na+/H+ antiporter subunit E [Beijerinckiaceae bacterium]